MTYTKKVFLVLALSIIIEGCMTSNFALTGSVYEPLPPDYPIKVLLTDKEEDTDYDEIGVLQVIQTDMNDLSEVINLAKKEARKRGGDLVKLFARDSKTSVSGYDYIYSSDENSYIFIICRIKN